ncbi:MlaD family protein [Gemmatimonadota bacterium]
MNFERQDFALGLFVLGALAAVVAGLITVAGILEKEKINLHIQVDTLPAVRRGTAVYVSGYRVGELIQITPVVDEIPFYFDLTLSVDADFPLYEGTAASIGAVGGLVGDAVVDLRIPERPGARLPDGAILPQITSPGLAQMISRADTLAQTVELVASNLAEILNPERAGILIDEFTNTMVFARETLALLEYELVALADSLRYVMRTATNSMDLVSSIIEENRPRFASTLDTTLTLVGNLSTLTQSADTMLDSTGPRIDRNLEQMEAVLEELHRLLSDMNTYSMWQMLFKVRPPDSTGGKQGIP